MLVGARCRYSTGADQSREHSVVLVCSRRLTPVPSVSPIPLSLLAEFAKGSPACNKAEANLEDGIRKHVSFATGGDGIISPSHSLQQTSANDEAGEDSGDTVRKPLSPGADSSAMDHDVDSSSLAHDPRAVALHSVAISSGLQDELSEPLARSGSGEHHAHPHISTKMRWDGTMEAHVDEE